MPSSHPEIRLADYLPPDFLIDSVALDIDIQADHARVTSRLSVRRNPKSKKKNAPLMLNGETQKLLSVKLGGKELPAKQYRVAEKNLMISDMPAKATLEIVSTHDPYKNTALSGLYASGPMLCTQCEAEGFRRITYYPDRPDVMAKFRVTIHADKKKYPVLLSNGNLIESGDEAGGRHFALWEDPYPKPCYLFALVAGKLDKVASHFTTKSGRKVLIEIFTEPGKGKETGFALAALKKAMAWDEKRYGLEYDLDRFMMVATPFFNMGAMENKGLNIFNDACVLGRTETATDGTISFIERVVGHEYFHNWTGDRITCRDWFQLSLKEGLTVFREQEFCGDMNSVAVERIVSVRDLRHAQFPEDAGPMAHPVRPDRYRAIDNFYTATVYDKGSELVRMIQTLVGRDGFRKGMDLYVKRHDGQAVTCDDFVKAMADAQSRLRKRQRAQSSRAQENKNKMDFTQFMRWYDQAGTPVLKVKSEFDAKRKELHLHVEQSCPPTSERKKKLPMPIPLAVGLLDEKGRDLIGTKVLTVAKARETFTFRNIAKMPALSLLRDYSAPVRLVYEEKDDALLLRLAHDSDPFNRWEAGQRLFVKYLMRGIAGKEPPKAEITKFAAALGALLRDTKCDDAFKALAITLPGEAELGLTLRSEGKFIDPAAIHEARRAMIRTLAKYLRDDLAKAHAAFAGLDPQAADGVSMGKRSLKNICLAYLAAGGDKKILATAFKQATKSRNMTDQIMALSILADAKSSLATRAFKTFEKRWRKQPLIMDRWLALQASARRPDVLGDVKKLMKHPAFDFKNPNRVSALIGSFAGNSSGFHNRNGSGYRFVSEMILKVDRVNPQSAARLAKAFARWRDYEPGRRAFMQKALKHLAAHKNLSPNCHEIVVRSLGKA
jgi:aminopeptidase N